jgi:hypothetical protein
MIGIMPIEQELKYFEDNRADLVRHYKGKWVVIKGTELIGAYDDSDAAYAAGVGRFRTEPFLVRQVTENDSPIQAPALFTGLVALN